MEAGNLSNSNPEFAIEAKSFLESCCQHVVKTVEDIQKRENIRLIGERLFYSQNIDRIQVKFFLYKLNEYKLKTYAEDNFCKTYELDSEKKKQWNDNKKDSQFFLNSVAKKVVHEYHGYTSKVQASAVAIQKHFRGYLSRLIHKMESMNSKIEDESRRAEERVRMKVSLKKQMSK